MVKIKFCFQHHVLAWSHKLLPHQENFRGQTTSSYNTLQGGEKLRQDLHTVLLGRCGNHVTDMDDQRVPELEEKAFCSKKNVKKKNSETVNGL